VWVCGSLDQAQVSGTISDPPELPCNIFGQSEMAGTTIEPKLYFTNYYFDIIFIRGVLKLN